MKKLQKITINSQKWKTLAVPYELWLKIKELADKNGTKIFREIEQKFK